MIRARAGAGRNIKNVMVCKAASFLLNLPLTLVALFLASLSLPITVTEDRRHWALVFRCRRLWWCLGYMKKSRAVTFGHVVMLGPDILQGDLEHELIHVEQAIRYPLIFPLLYWVELARHGYRKNRFEEEAYRRAGNPYLGK